MKLSRRDKQGKPTFLEIVLNLGVPIHTSSIDNETTKRREERAAKETYIPTYVTSDPQEKAGQKEKLKREMEAEFDGDIWELAGRSNSKNPKQDLGQIKSEL